MGDLFSFAQCLRSSGFLRFPTIRTFVPANAFIYNVGTREGHNMKKVYISLNEAEWRLLLYALNNLRSTLIAEGRYTDVVDEVMLKIINAPIRMIKVAG